MRDLFAIIGLSSGIRKTAKQKSKFLYTISEPFQRSGREIKTTQEDLGIGTSVLLWIGNEQSATRIVCANYDTGSLMLAPGFQYSVMNQSNNESYEKKNSVIGIVLAVLFFAVIVLISFRFMTYPLILKIVVGIADALLLWFTYGFTRGVVNPVNFNNNSGGVILALKCAADFRNNNKNAFVFTDNDAVGDLGIQQMLLTLGDKKEDKTYLVLKAVASGKDVFVICTEEAEKEADLLIKGASVPMQKVVLNAVQKQNSVLARIRKGMVLTCGTMEDGIVYAENVRTKKDESVDMDRMNALYQAIKTYLSK
ncbi:MAG: hypothetical protein HUJ58_05330 [Erysipelotrichaceae bacterium]|nr:hypothetical protein [Erysipelotrichaceae bacterium]